ncbi:MAG: N-acetyltransferase [Chloroflexi bacterium]|nr:MAG: N-acetyltransferase [Chloroflexota bacterium]
MNDRSKQLVHSLKISTITRSTAPLLLNWHYPRPYHIYNMASDDPADAAATIAYLLNPAHQFYEMTLPKEGVVGFCSFGEDGQVPGGDYSQPALDIGMGIHPNLTGKGLGAIFVQAVIQFGMEMFRPTLLRVTIATFNERAQRVWQQNGFQPGQAFVHEGTKRPFIIFTCKV